VVPLKEQRAVDQRLQFVMAHLQGTSSMAELCRQFQVSRKTGYKWVQRFLDGGVPTVGPSISALLALLLAGCAGESVRDIAVCQNAWQEIQVPAELSPFYPVAAAWTEGRLYLVGGSDPQGASRESGLIYDPSSGFSVMSDQNIASLGVPVAALADGDGIFFLAGVDDSGRYDVATDSWSLLPRPDTGTGVLGSAVWLGDRIAISYLRASKRSTTGTEAAFFTYSPGDDAWKETSPPPLSDWQAPALTWTGQAMLAWGGVDSAGAGVSIATRYDPADDTWSALSTDGAPTTDGDGIVWTDPDAVAWATDPTTGSESAGRYDPTLDSWRSVSTPPTGNLGKPAIAANGRVVGWTGTTAGLPLITSYDPRADAWLTAPSRCGPARRVEPLLIRVDGGVVVWGSQRTCDPGDDACEAERQRVFFLSDAALLGEVHDEGACVCAKPQ
jgi:hypothetical protein